MEITKKNEEIIDILKTIGILMIILAHVCDNKIIMQIRSFDVPLLVIVSGMLSISSCKKSKSIKDYYKKRILRLIIPTYIFIIFYFILIKLLKIVVGDYDYRVDIAALIKSFLLMDGIGYIWIIRIYLLTAIITPLIIKLKELNKNKLYLGILIGIYIVYEITYLLIGDANLFLKNILYYIIPYGCILAIGMECSEFNKKKSTKKYFFGIIAMIIYVISAIIMYLIHGEYIYTSVFKYPPRIYYISYAVFISMVLIIILERINLKKISKKILNSVNFISRHSLWIYIWHVIYISMLEWGNFEINWIIEYFIIVLISVVTTIIQNKILDKVEKKRRYKVIKYLRS